MRQKQTSLRATGNETCEPVDQRVEAQAIGKPFWRKSPRLRAICISLLGIGLVWLVLTASLPFALAPDHSETALWLAPQNPTALLHKAGQLRSLLQEAPSNLSEAKSDEIRREIRHLARAVVKNDPLNAKAFRLLGEVATGRARRRSFMKAAVSRSRRETVAVNWLLRDAFALKRWDEAIAYADVMLRTRPGFAHYTVGVLGAIADHPDGRAALVATLQQSPSWRPVFFRDFPESVSRSQTPLLLMLDLKYVDDPPTVAEQRPFLDFLIAKSRIDLAYNAWLQLLADDTFSSLELLQNASFEREPSGLPFDWKIATARNAVVEIAKERSASANKALRVKFLVGRVTSLEVAQIVMLSPGSYTLKGEHKGTVDSNRGLRWQLQCFEGAKDVVGQSKMFLKAEPDWQNFTFEFVVPDKPNCAAQELRLIHDSRTASEQIATGEAWFEDLQISRVRRGQRSFAN